MQQGHARCGTARKLERRQLARRRRTWPPDSILARSLAIDGFSATHSTRNGMAPSEAAASSAAHNRPRGYAARQRTRVQALDVPAGPGRVLLDEKPHGFTARRTSCVRACGGRSACSRRPRASRASPAYAPARPTPPARGGMPRAPRASPSAVVASQPPLPARSRSPRLRARPLPPCSSSRSRARRRS